MNNHTKTKPLLRRAQILIEDEDYENALRVLETFIASEPDNALAYILRLMATCEVKDENDIAKQEFLLSENEDFKFAYRYSDAAGRVKLDKLITLNKTHFTETVFKQRERAIEVKKQELEKLQQEAKQGRKDNRKRIFGSIVGCLITFVFLWAVAINPIHDKLENGKWNIRTWESSIYDHDLSFPGEQINYFNDFFDSELIDIGNTWILDGPNTVGNYTGTDSASPSGQVFLVSTIKSSEAVDHFIRVSFFEDANNKINRFTSACDSDEYTGITDTSYFSFKLLAYPGLFSSNKNESDFVSMEFDGRTMELDSCCFVSIRGNNELIGDYIGFGRNDEWYLFDPSILSAEDGAIFAPCGSEVIQALKEGKTLQFKITYIGYEFDVTLSSDNFFNAYEKFIALSGD